MQDRYYIHKVDLEGLTSQDFAELLRTKKAQGEKVCILMEASSTFDEWDIEKYVEAFNKLQPDRVQITVNDTSHSRPTMHQLFEIQCALEHFATFERYDEAVKCQYFNAGGIEILFLSEPVK